MGEIVKSWRADGDTISLLSGQWTARYVRISVVQVLGDRKIMRKRLTVRGPGVYVNKLRGNWRRVSDGATFSAPLDERVPPEGFDARHVPEYFEGSVGLRIEQGGGNEDEWVLCYESEPTEKNYPWYSKGPWVTCEETL